MGLFAFMNGNCQSFWADEIASIGFVRNGLSISEMLNTYLYRETNLPLYSLLLYVVYRIMPYGEKYLLLPSILFCLAGIVLLAASAYRLKGKRAGFIALCLGVSSSSLLWQAAWEIRCYAMAFFFSALVFYTFVGKCRMPDRKHMILFATAVALCLWTHWFACIMLFFYGVTDLLMAVLRKISWKHLLCYVPGCLLFFPWLFVSFYFKGGELDHFWTEVPQWKDMVWTVLFYLNGNRILWFLCLLTGLLLFAKVVPAVRQADTEEKTEVMLSAFCVAVVAWVIGVVFVFSKYINPQGSLYVQRYFTVVHPHILLITTLGVEEILNLADRLPTQRVVLRVGRWTLRAAVVLLLAVTFGICYRDSYKAIRKPLEPYREAADYLVREGGVWADTALFVGSNEACMLDGFVHYYIEKRGYEAPPHIVDSMVHSEQETRFYPNYAQIPKEELLSYDKIYCLRIHMGVDEEMEQFLAQHYRLVQAKDEYGVEIWEKK
ncbi:MAG: hypothetical protein NC302_04790 [Bacteroidales bacterium]|nr:hypothetical protein [Bacteroidales bacterium]MCM1415995.1 hypothetical protein [bacterium]MCM1422823.1 hypothetical protein [bacterium]